MISDKNIFIIGVGRSGTSLLQSMLDSNSYCIFLPETRFLRKYVFNKKESTKINKNGINYFKAILKSDQGFARTNLNLDEIFNNVKKSDNCLSFEVYKVFSNQYKKEDNIVIGDKDPRNIENIKNLANFFPHSKIVHIIRDPRDVVLSRTKAKWSENRPWWLHALIYYAQYTYGTKSAKKNNLKNYYEIKYENLINSPKTELSALCEFLEIPFEDEMLKFQNSATRLISKEELQWKKETLGDLLPHNSNKWKSEFSPKHIYFIESVCKNTITKHKYIYSTNKGKLSIISKLGVNLISNLKYFFYLLFKIKLKFYV